MKRLGVRAHLLTWFIVCALLKSVPAFAWHDGIQAVAIDPVTPTTIYATVAPATLFKSTDGGANWTRSTLPATGHVPALVIDPLNRDPLNRPTLYVATDSGVLKSADGGTTWQATGLGGTYSGLVIDPVTPTTVYAVHGWGFTKTTDGFETWHEIGGFGPLAVDPVTPTTLYSGHMRQYFAGSSAVLKSFDGGETWTPFGVPYPWPYGGLSVLAIDPVTQATLYAGAGVDYLCPECESDMYPELFGVTVPGGAFKSTDGGVSWQPIGLHDAQAFSLLVVHPTATTTIYAVTDRGLLKTTDGGTMWRATGLSTTDVRAVVIDPLTPDTIYAGTESGVFKSIDGGDTWSATGAMEPAVTAVRSVSLAPATVVGGDSTTGTVVLNWPAPAGGIVVTLASGNPPTASVPSAVTVPSGSLTATFVVTTVPLWNIAAITHGISATAGGVTRGASLTIIKAPLGATSVRLSPSNVVGGGSSTGTILLNAPASGSGTVVTLSSGNTAAASVPSAVTVPSGTTTATFAVATSPVPTATVVTISASDGWVTRTATLTVNTPPPPPVTLVSLSLDPTTVNGVGTSTGTVTLSAAAPAGGAVVMLSSSDTAAATVPPSVTVLSTSTSATFTVTTKTVTTATPVTITATFGGDTRPATLTVDTPPNTAITSAIDGRGKSIANGGTTPSSTMIFRFTGTDNGTIARFECSVDSPNFTSCTSPATYSNVGRGTHTFKVRAIDNNGFQDLSPAVFNWRR